MYRLRTFTFDDLFQCTVVRLARRRGVSRRIVVEQRDGTIFVNPPPEV